MSSSPMAGASGQDQRLACQRDPERWFDHTHRAQALSGCLHCRARLWCAREALAVRPVFGMWAGIWINDNFAEVTSYLQAIADTTPPMADARVSVAALIAARASGHCEILARNCQLSAGAVLSRLPRCAPAELPDPASGYLCCGSCRSVVTRMETPLARRLGYLVDACRDPGTVPFYWRQSRWVLLDLTGSARAVPELDRPA